MNSTFISNLQKKRCNYNHPDQATSQANSLILLSSGIYTEEERFVFELLQNAVDAHNEESEILDVKMIIKDGYFIFLHNGEAFTERDIEGLCDVGNGNKMKDVKKIGYKGIGFKSVFMRSTNVTVQSGGYCFKFDKSHWDNYWNEHWNDNDFGARDTEKKYLMPWQIIPIETTPPISLSDYDYNVATYIKINGTDSLEQKILKLLSSSQFLLFLMSDNIRMTFESNGKTECWIEKQKQNNQVVLSTNGKEESRWLIHTNSNVEVPQELKEAINADINTPDKLKNVDTFDLSFAVALDEKGKLKRLEQAVVYTYLPTSFCFGSEGFPFLVNANFITDAGRQQLHKDSEWNKLIFSKIPSEYLTWMKEISTAYKNYWEVLPEKTYGQGNALEEIYADEMEKAINQIAFIPCVKDSSQKVLAADAFMDRMGISDAISVEALVNHINRTYSCLFENRNQIANIWKGSRILNDYGVFIFDKQKLKKLFDDKRAFENISPEFNAKLIDFLFGYYMQNKTEQEEFVSILQSTQFILDDKASLCIPGDLFFPSTYKEQNELAEDAKLLNQNVYDLIESNNAIIDWLSKLGVESLSDVTFIKNVICKSGYVTKDNSIEVIRYLFEINRNINIFEEIGDYYFSNLKFLTKNNTLAEANSLYLGSFYKPDVDIEKVYDGDIYVSEDYSQNEDATEWNLFFKKMGVHSSLVISQVRLKDTKNYSLLSDLKSKFEKEYNVGSWGTHFYYSFSSFLIYYAPFILTNECSHSFQKLIWSSILTKEYIPQTDKVEGSAGFWGASRTFGDLDKENFIEWAFKNIQCFPSSNGCLLKPNDLFLNTEEIRNLAGSYLPVIAVEGDIHESWNNLLCLRNTIRIDDCFTILTQVSHDSENVEQNKERITKLYQRLIELDALSTNNRNKVVEWASNNLILSKDNEFVAPTTLSHITLDGFGPKNRVYIGNPSNKDKVVELLALMGVKIITPQSIKAEFEDKKENEELKQILKGKISPLALIATGENGEKLEYVENKSRLNNLIDETHFYHCGKIQLTYGNSDDVIEKHTFGNKNEFYYIGNLRPANIEPLLEPLCRYLGIKGKERELFIMFYENIDGIKQNLKDKGYDVSLIEDEIIPASGNLNVSLDYHPDESAQERNLITGFKGEIIVYEKLVAMGYKPVCPSISTKDDYEKEVVVNGKTYYCKSNYNSECDISFETETGHQMLIEVKSTTTSVGYIENMPISSNEWSMIKECDKERGKSYLIVRVFGIDSPTQDIYLFKGHLFE